LSRSISEVTKIQNITKCSPETSVHDAVKILQAGKIGSIIVTDGLKVLGIFTERDYLLKCALKPMDPQTEPICDYMTANPVCAQRHTSIGQVLISMGKGKFRHIIVTDNYQNIEAVLSMKEIVAFLVSSISDGA
jgi:CBS domain-containing protein